MIIEGYGWAQNRSKLERAIEEVKEKKGDKGDEEDVKVVYRRLKGFVIGEDVRISFPKALEGLTSKEIFLLAEKKKKQEEALKKGKSNDGEDEDEDEEEKLTKDEIMEKLDEKKIEYNPKDKKADLEALLE